MEAIAEINRWVASATNNLIDSIVGPSSVHQYTNLVLANAIYFKGKWTEPFRRNCTKDYKFHRHDGRSVDVPFMRSWADQLIAVHRGFKVLKLWYQAPEPQDARYSMCLFLPDKRDGLPALVKRVASNTGFWRDHLPKHWVAVGDFRLPKFRIEFSRSIRRVLEEQMGIKAAFHAEKVDLWDMAKRHDVAADKKLAVEDVLHKALVELNVEGTEVAVVTAIMDIEVSASLAPKPPRKTVDFVADHPFMFFVIEEVSGAIVFVGHVVDPSNSG